MINQPISFSNEYEQKITFKKALCRVTEIPGPLHMAFHMCQCLYIIYGDFLRHCQKIVGWKKLNYLKVSESFRLCKALLFLALEEAERLMWDIYIQDQSTTILEKISVYPEKAFCVWLAHGFSKFLEDVLSKSTDERRKLLASYIIAVTEFKMFCESIRVGDRLYQE